MKRLILTLSLVAIAVAGYANDKEVVRVSSLEELLPYFKMDGVHVILDKGEYRITGKDMDEGKYLGTSEVVEGRVNNAIFLAEGSGSTYDFGGSIIYTEIKDVFNSPFLSGELSNLHILGNNNFVTNVTFIDDGSIYDLPPKGCTNIIIDGRENTVDNITLYSTGSSPYGYGEVFGKGGGAKMRLRKHCGVLVRGDDNTFQNSVVVHKAYGHCVFMQGAVRPNIINNRISSEMTTTRAILAERGDENSRANAIDFLTTWNFNMSDEFTYTIALCEAGIRAYIRGNTMIDGVRYSRGRTDGPYVAGNYVKDTRVGVTLTHSSNHSRQVVVENCTTVGTERGYAVNDGAIIRDCYSDAKHGPAYGVDYKSGKDNIVDITIIDEVSDDFVTSHYDGKLYRTNNGTGHIAYIQGMGHQIKFRDGRVKDKDRVINTECPDKSIEFCAFDLGGDIRTVGNIWASTQEEGVASQSIRDDEAPLSSTYIANETTLPMRVDENAKGNFIWSVGEVFEQVVGDNQVTTGTQWDINTVF